FYLTKKLALKKYVNINETDLQAVAFDLLAYLLLIRFNYCLLDADEVRSISNRFV
ncbi:unnamed protein product, partial [Rotaria sp. Silwood1]